MDIVALKADAVKGVDALTPELLATSRFLHDNPELAYEERKAAAHLSGLLERHGFTAKRGIAGLDTAFVATYGPADARPAIAFLAEYDALPGMGHACGHNLIGASAIGAALATKAALGGLPARVMVVGCPAEEKGGGKIPLVEAGVFKGVDAALIVHPSNRTELVKMALGMRDVLVEFFGRASHAAASPHLGVNALDAVIASFNAINALRQQVRGDARVHGVIVHGGQAPNIIPDYAAARFYVRAIDLPYLDELYGRVIGCFEGAARATGTRLQVTRQGKDYHPFRANHALADLFGKNLAALGERVDQGPEDKELGSTDVGNVSQVVPTIQPTIAISDPDVTCHMEAFARAAISERGHRGMVLGAKAMAMTALDLVAEPENLRRVRAGFEGPDRAGAGR